MPYGRVSTDWLNQLMSLDFAFLFAEIAMRIKNTIRFGAIDVAIRLRSRRYGHDLDGFKQVI